MAGQGVAIHSYNFAGDTEVCMSDWTISIKENTSTSNWNTEQGHGHTNWMKMLTMLISRKTSLDVWNINSDWTDWCRILLVKATSISSFCCNSMVHVLTIRHDRDQDIMLKQWISSQIWLDISLKWSDIQHNWSEIVTGTSSPDLLCWTVGGNAWANRLHLCHNPLHCMPSLGYSDGV